MQSDPLRPDILIDFDKVKEYTYIMIGISVGAFFFPFFAWLIFGILGESMTKNIW